MRTRYSAATVSPANAAYPVRSVPHGRTATESSHAHVPVKRKMTASELGTTAKTTKEGYSARQAQTNLARRASATQGESAL